MPEIESNIDQANKIGNLFNSWGKIIMIFGGAIVSCSIAYYRIFDNEKEIAIEKKERIEHEADAEYKADKRYKDAMGIAEELKEYIKYQEQEIVKMKEKQAYMEGYIKGKEFNNK